MTYEIVEEGQAIKCLVCGLTSWHPQDVEYRFCGKCDRFHDAPSAPPKPPPPKVAPAKPQSGLWDLLLKRRGR
jgi:hypothetical protein